MVEIRRAVEKERVLTGVRIEDDRLSRVPRASRDAECV